MTAGEDDLRRYLVAAAAAHVGPPPPAPLRESRGEAEQAAVPTRMGSRRDRAPVEEAASGGGGGAYSVSVAAHVICDDRQTTPSRTC